jgi:hypothetical protein
MADDDAFEARKLLRAARSATLATATDGGQPFASLVIHACAPDLTILLLISDLSEHTRHLKADPRFSLLAAGAPPDANPQTAPRITVTGLAEPVEDAGLKQRFLAIHPYASLYADFGDFRIWRLQPMAGWFVGGFARATRIRRDDLRPDAAAVAAVSAAADSIIGHCNTDHADALAAIAGEPGPWRMVAVDTDGMDLARDQRVIRVAWPAPVADAGGVRGALVGLARAARGG